MTTLDFAVEEVVVDRRAITPTLLLRTRISESTRTPIHAVVLRCQLRIEPQRRRYDPDEQEALVDLFGTPERWGTTAKPFLWAHAVAAVPGFTGETTVDVPIACTYDLEVTASKYLHALADGIVPVIALFSGTVFSRGETGFSVEPIGWDREARVGLEVATWRALVDHHFPGSGWLRVHRDTLDDLSRFRSGRGFTSWEQTVDALLREAGAPDPQAVSP